MRKSIGHDYAFKPFCYKISGVLKVIFSKSLQQISSRATFIFVQGLLMYNATIGQKTDMKETLDTPCLFNDVKNRHQHF